MKGSSTKAFNHNNFYYYSACVMEFDKALGEIMRQLDVRGLLDDTVLLLYGDHNTYYSSLSNYVKNIDNEKAENYTNLYRVPCMIYYPNMTEIANFLNSEKANKVGSRYIISSSNYGTKVQVKKFSCTADIMPTLMDLLGINYYENLYFGHSIFDDEVSVLYSRAYDMFITDSIYFSSLNNIKWIRKDQPIVRNDPATSYADLTTFDREDHINAVEEEAKILLKKLDSCNRIFYNNYFGRKNIHKNELKNVEIFKSNLQTIN